MPAVKNPKRSTRRPPKPAALPRALDDGRESLDLYLDEISRIPLLTVDEEKALARKAFRGDVARPGTAGAPQRALRGLGRQAVPEPRRAPHGPDRRGQRGPDDRGPEVRPGPRRQVHLLRGLVDPSGDPGGAGSSRPSGAGAAQPYGGPEPARPCNDLSGRASRPGSDHRGAGRSDRAHAGVGSLAGRAPHRGAAPRPADARGRRSLSHGAGGPGVRRGHRRGDAGQEPHQRSGDRAGLAAGRGTPR